MTGCARGRRRLLVVLLATAGALLWSAAWGGTLRVAAAQEPLIEVPEVIEVPEPEPEPEMPAPEELPEAEPAPPPEPAPAPQPPPGDPEPAVLPPEVAGPENAGPGRRSGSAGGPLLQQGRGAPPGEGTGAPMVDALPPQVAEPDLMLTPGVDVAPPAGAESLDGELAGASGAFPGPDDGGAAVPHLAALTLVAGLLARHEHRQRVRYRPKA